MPVNMPKSADITGLSPNSMAFCARADQQITIDSAKTSRHEERDKSACMPHMALSPFLRCEASRMAKPCLRTDYQGFDACFESRMQDRRKLRAVIHRQLVQLARRFGPGIGLGVISA